jgi:hypothetical protein
MNVVRTLKIWFSKFPWILCNALTIFKNLLAIWSCSLFQVNANLVLIITYPLLLCTSKVVHMPVCSPRLPARLLRPIDLHAHQIRKYSSIFKHIWVYSRYFKRIFSEYVQYVQFILDIIDRTTDYPPTHPLGPPNSLRTPSGPV